MRDLQMVNSEVPLTSTLTTGRHCENQLNGECRRVLTLSDILRCINLAWAWSIWAGRGPQCSFPQFSRRRWRNQRRNTPTTAAIRGNNGPNMPKRELELLIHFTWRLNNHNVVDLKHPASPYCCPYRPASARWLLATAMMYLVSKRNISAEKV